MLTSPYNKPSLLPPTEHPRLMVRAADLDRVRKNMTLPETQLAVKLWKELCDQPITCVGADPEYGTYDLSEYLSLEAKALKALLSGNKDDARAAIDGAVFLLQSSEFDKGIMKARWSGHLIFASSLVYDWCYSYLTSEEKRIITESPGAGFSVGDAPAAVTGDDMLRAVGIDESAAAGEPGAPVGCSAEIGKEKRVVFRGVGLVARIAGAAHPRRTAESIHLQSGIIGHAPLSWMQFSDGTHFDKRVPGEIGSVFDRSCGIVRHDFETGKNLSDFADFMPVVRSYVKNHIP